MCPGCGAPVIAKHAPSGKLRPHFAHEADSACSTGTESALHLAAKQLIAERMAVFLPRLETEVRGRVFSLTERVCLEPVHRAGRLALDHVELEKKLDRTRPDLVVTADCQQILIEIAVTHFVDQLKLDELTRLGLPAVEFDLSDLRECTFQEIERCLFENSVSSKWLYHPAEPAARAAAQARLDELLAADELQWIADEQRRKYEREAEERAALERERGERARKQKRQAEATAEAQIEIERRAGDLAKAAKFKARGPEEKLNWVCRYMGASRTVLPDFVRIPVWSSSAISAPLQVWQASVFAALIHTATQTGAIDINVDSVRAWLSLRFDFNEHGGNPSEAVWCYLKGLSDLGLLGKRGKQEFVVTVSGWSSALEVATESKAPGKRPQVWAESWPNCEQSLNLARAFGEMYGKHALWERVAGLLPSNRDKESPIHTSLHYTATHGAHPELLRRFFLGAGFTKLA